MKAVDYRHNVSTDHRSHSGDGPCQMGRLATKPGKMDKDVNFKKWRFAAD